jgi:hypothetical protein
MPGLGPGIHAFLSGLLEIESRGWRGKPKGCPVHFVLEEAHGIDSSRFQKVSKRLDTKEDQRRAASK